MAEDIRDSIIELVSANPQLSYLCKSITSGTISARKGFLPTKAADMLSVCYSPWIRICRLNKTAIRRYIDWIGCYSPYEMRSEKRSRVLSLFNKYSSFSSRNYHSHMDKFREDALYAGVNIYKDLKINGYSFNICDFIGNFIADNYNRNDCLASFTKRLYKVIYVGEKNFFVGFIDCDAVMYLDEVILKKIKDYNENIFHEVLTRIMSVYANANSIFFDLHTVDISNIIKAKLSQYLTSSITKCGDECNIISPDHIDIFDDYSAVTGLIEKLKEEMDTVVSNMIKNTTWGVNNQYSYKKLLDENFRNEDISNDRKIEESFIKGMLFGNKVETCGWKVSDQTFDNSITWEKEVNIVPVRFYYNCKCYRINNNDPKWKNPFKITKLYVTAKGTMRCEGYHPNTNHGNVCMGDISGKIVMSNVKKIQENLNRCESLLYTINYDSPYDSSRREELISHSIEEGSDEFNQDDNFVSSGQIIQEVNFENEEDVSDDIPDESIQLEVIGND